MNFRVLLILGFCIKFASAQQVCTGFNSGTVGGQYIQQHFSAAVVKVQDVGTAYLIDAEHGYLLTAGHVLDQLTAKNEPYEILTGQSSSQHLPFLVSKRLQNLDVALLQLTKADALKNVRALDIAFEAPDFDAFLFVMGYPQYGQQKQIFLRGGDAKVDSYPPSGFVEINHITAGGSSGGPLIDAFGDAVATCQEEIADHQVGRYLPHLEFEELLNDIPVTSRMQGIEKRLLTGATSVDEFKQLLERGNSQSPTNLELYVWLHKLGASPASWRTISAKYLRCPLMPALVERHIPDAIYPLVASQQSPQAGEVKLALAQREYTMGRTNIAAQLANESLASFSEASPTASPLRQKALLLGWAIDQQNKIEQKSDAENVRVIRQQVVPVSVTLDSGVVEKYLVHWLGTVASTKSEEGHPSEPLKGWFTDTRKCHWSIQSEVVRKVYYVDQKGQASTDNGVTRVFHSGFGNQGSDFVLTQLRPENCGDSAARYQSDVNDAQAAVATKFHSIIMEDRERLAEELRTLPHVANVTVLPPNRENQ
jgi:hypothetical protein